MAGLMGGFGSTRWGWHRRRQTIEDAPLALRMRDLAALVRRPADVTGHLAWPGPNDPRATINFTLETVTRARRSLTLHYSAGPAGGLRQDITELLTLVADPARLGGVRWWLMCPGCNTRRTALYLAPGSRVFRCRACQRLAYHSQRLAPRDRLTHRARVIARRLGAEYRAERTLLVKPKRMHRRTYERHCAALEAIEEARDREFAIAGARVLRWIDAQTARRVRAIRWRARRRR